MESTSISEAPEVSALRLAMADVEGWAKRGADLHKDYLRAKPWPHLVLHDVLSPELVAAAEAQELPAARQLVPHRSHLEVKGESPRVAGPAAAALLDAMCSESFVAFVSALTRIEGLVPDPTHTWSGLNASGPGFFQSMHRDFFRHPVTKLWHRVNVLLYLSTTWEPAWGGQLELWPADMSACGAKIEPIGNTMVVFETHYDTIHGLPEPIRCPEGHARLSLASYYYSTQRQPGRVREPLVRRPRRPQDPWHYGVAESRHVAMGLVHPLYERLPTVQRRVDRLRRDLGSRDPGG